MEHTEFHIPEMEELERMAQDLETPVPENLSKEMSDMVNLLDFMEESDEKEITLPEHSRRIGIFTRIAGIAASAAVLIGIGFGMNYEQNPKDTFTDPQQAYESVLAALQDVSSKMNQCVAATEEAARAFETAKEIIYE